MIKQVIQQLRVPDAGIENLQERRYWLQCERAYTYQPIYQTDGRLMAVELLTVVTHPDNPSRRIAPDRYFAELAVRHRIDVVKEQLHQLEQKRIFHSPSLIGIGQCRRPYADCHATTAGHSGSDGALTRCVSNWWNIFVCRKTPLSPRCVSSARCGWMILVPVWPIFQR